MEMFAMKFRRHPEGVQEKFISASCLVSAYQVANRWCELETERIAAFQPIKLIGVEPAVVANEDILKIERQPVVVEKEVIRPSLQEQRGRIEARNMAERALPDASPTQPAEVKLEKPERIWDQVKNLAKK